MFGFAALVVLAGCGQHDYKSEADEKVYNIIDQKWQNDFGSKVNYKISDVEPSPNDIKIEKVIPASGILTLPQAVAIATAHNRQYQLEKEILYTTALDLTLFRHEFEPWFFSGARQGYGKEGSAEGVGAEADLGFQMLLATGARIGTKVALAWFNVLTGDIRGGLASILSVTLTQPLLRGSDSKIVMENLTQAERNTVYQIRSFNQFRKVFVVSVISQYYFVLQQHDFLQNAKNNLESLTDVYDKTEKLVDAGRLPRHELERVRQERLNAQDILIQAEKNYKQSLDEFKISLSLPTATEFKLDENELEVLRIPSLSKPDFSKNVDAGQAQSRQELTEEEIALLEKEFELLTLVQSKRVYHNHNDTQTQHTCAQLEQTHKQVLDELGMDNDLPAYAEFQSNRETTGFSEEDVIETALTLRLDLANRIDAIHDAERKVQVAADNLRGELNLFVGVDATSLAGSSELPGVGALDDDFAADRNRLNPLKRLRDNNPLRSFQDLSEIGVDLELPLDRVAEQNVYHKALITLNQRQREFEEAVDIVVLEVRQAYRNLTEAAERYRLQLESLELAQKRFNNTMLLMQYGRANSRRVLDARRDLFNAQNAATDALTNHTIAMLSFYRDTGVLQVRPDGMWEY